MQTWPDEMQTLLLRASLLEGSPAQEAWNAWAERIDFDHIDPASYKLTPLVACNPSLESVKHPVFEKCKGIYRRTWVSNQLSWKKMTPFLHQLIGAGVQKIVLLKGMAMILHFYRNYGVRVIGDIDILIPKEDVAIALPFLKSSGWTYVHNPEDLEKLHALNCRHPSELYLDLHWSLIQENSPALDKAVLAGAIPLNNTPFYIPNPTDLLLQTCVHGVKYSPVPLIRWIADAITLLKHPNMAIDWDRLGQLATLARISTPLSAALTYLAQEFNAPIPAHALRKLKKMPSIRLEKLEYRSHLLGRHIRANWYRYCLNRGHLTLCSRLLNAHKYVQFAGRLRSPWQVPWFIIRWVVKRIWTLLFSRWNFA